MSKKMLERLYYQCSTKLRQLDMNAECIYSYTFNLFVCMCVCMYKDSPKESQMTIWKSLGFELEWIGNLRAVG